VLPGRQHAGTQSLNLENVFPLAPLGTLRNTADRGLIFVYQVPRTSMQLLREKKLFPRRLLHEAAVVGARTARGRQTRGSERYRPANPRFQ